MRKKFETLDGECEVTLPLEESFDDVALMRKFITLANYVAEGNFGIATEFLVKINYPMGGENELK